MSDLLIRTVEQPMLRDDVPEVEVGDIVRVYFRIVEGNRERVQPFQGTVIRISGGGINKMMTVRRIASHGIGVERTFPLHSPRLEKIDILRHSKVRRSKLYYLRERRGKKARLKQRYETKKAS
ncbi:MAG: 50S ribosomal protein L19 [Chloroflexi bacterium]|nr:50S ribosomal protein L19 [Chloroflexota bacterium]